MWSVYTVEWNATHPCILPSLEGCHFKVESHALHKLFGVLLYGRHTSSPLLAYSITSIGMDSWIFSFILCFITQHYIIYFVAQIVCVFHCLIPGTTTRARLSPPLESAVSPGSSGFFSQRMMLETKTWMCPLLLGYTCFWALSGDRASHVPSHIASTISQFS